MYDLEIIWVFNAVNPLYKINNVMTCFFHGCDVVIAMRQIAKWSHILHIPDILDKWENGTLTAVLTAVGSKWYGNTPQERIAIYFYNCVYQMYETKPLGVCTRYFSLGIKNKTMNPLPSQAKPNCAAPAWWRFLHSCWKGAENDWKKNNQASTRWFRFAQ